MGKLSLIPRKNYTDSEITVYEEVSLAVAQGKSEQLDERQKPVLERLKKAYNIVSDNPNKRVAVEKLKEMYPSLSHHTLYNDINYAIRIFNPMNRVDKDFLETVMVNALIEEIKNPSASEDAKAKNLATLQRYISSMPQEPMDPMMMEKHKIYIQLNVNGSTINVPPAQWASLKNNQVIADALEQEITDAEAVEIMEG